MKIKELEPFIPLLLKNEEIWLVGGAIRDYILGIPTNDFDFAIKGNARQFARWFANKVKGAFVLLDEERDEVRVVCKNSYIRRACIRQACTFDFSSMVHHDLHHGVESIEKDLARRDFTINAMAAKLPELKMLDPHNGKKDIKNKIIRMISEEALLEDPLRILRGFRFKATLGFKIDSKTLKVFISNKALLNKVARERIREELFKILNAGISYPTIRHMARTGVLQVIIPQIKNLPGVPQGKPTGNLLDHSLLTVKKMETNCKEILYIPALNKYFNKNLPVLKLAALLHDIGKPKCYTETKDGEVHFYGHEKAGVKILTSLQDSLRLSNSEFKILSNLILYHMRPHLLATEKTLTDKAVWRLARDVNEDTPGVLLLAYADMLASGQRGKKRLLNVVQRGIAMWEKIQEPKFKRLLTGNDLIKLGLEPGTEFKKILQAIEEAQISSKLNNHKEAIEFVKRKFIL